MVSARWVAPLLLFVVAIPALAQSRSSSRPPQNLKLVGDHWTPYNPPDPATYPPGARTHTIVRGDTLWALAQTYYGNAYLWPQLWEANTWITDAHWIYPGDVLLVEGEAAAQAAAAAGSQQGTGAAEAELSGGSVVPQTGAEGELATAQVMPMVRPPIPLGSDYDVYCYGYIGDPREPMPNRISSFEDVEIFNVEGAVDQDITGSTGDLVYLEGGRSTGLIAGETYIVIEPGPIVRHPRTREIIGRHYDYRGQLRVLCADDGQSRGMITYACKEIRTGSRLKPMPQIPIPLARIPDLPGFCDPPSGLTSGYIINSEGWELALGEGNLVQINLGRDNQIQPGDFLTVWRDSPIEGQPRQILGEIGILTTENNTATARIVAMRRTMLIGDHVELVAR